MSEPVNIQRKIYGKQTFTSVVDTSFKDLVPKDNSSVSITQEVTDFFNSYDNLFYEIPPSGSNNSHLELVNRSSQYLGISYQDLIEELRVTRDENVSLKNQLFILSGIK